MYVDAGERLRFSRHVERGRVGAAKAVEDFRIHDRKQWEFGLLEKAAGIVDVPRDVADFRIVNEGTLKDYYAHIDALAARWSGLAASEEMYMVGGDAGGAESRVEPVEQSRIFRCLQALCRFGALATCAEICEQIVKREKESVINTRHVNWTLGKAPVLAERVAGEGKPRYRILPAGRAYVEAVRRRA